MADVRRRRPQPLERPHHQTRHLNRAKFPGRGEALRPDPASANPSKLHRTKDFALA
jgi:hypothetical protein